MACLGQWPAKHKRQMGVVIVTTTSVIHETSELNIPINMCLHWLSSKEGPPPKLPLVQVSLTNEKKRTFEFTTWPHQREFAAALGAAKRSDGNTVPSTNATPQKTGSSQAPVSCEPSSSSTAPIPRSNGVRNVDSPPVAEVNDSLKVMARVLTERPKVKKLYDALVPETLTTEAFFEAFQEQLALSQTQIEPQLVRYSAAAPIKITTDGGGATVKLSKEDMEALFLEHSNIRKVYMDVVEEAGTMTASQFFARFFRSNYYLKCEGKEPSRPPDVLFDSIPPPKKVEREVPHMLTQWNTTKREIGLQKDALLLKLNRISAEPLESLPNFVADAPVGEKRPLEPTALHLQPSKIFKSKQSTEQLSIDRNTRFMELSSRPPTMKPEAPECQRAVRAILQAQTQRLRVDVLEHPALSTEFHTVEALLAHYYQSNDDTVKIKLRECLKTFTPPASLLRAVQKIINT